VEYTVDQVEKAAISQLSRSGLLGQILTLELSSAPSVGDRIPVRVVVRDEEVDATVHKVESLGLAVFVDSRLSVPATDVYLTAATTGEITAGDGSGAVAIRTSEVGVFECTAQCSVPGAVRYLAADHMVGSGILDCSMVRTLTYP
jgi:hypothetical protein